MLQKTRPKHFQILGIHAVLCVLQCSADFQSHLLLKLLNSVRQQLNSNHCAPLIQSISAESGWEKQRFWFYLGFFFFLCCGMWQRRCKSVINWDHYFEFIVNQRPPEQQHCFFDTEQTKEHRLIFYVSLAHLQPFIYVPVCGVTVLLSNCIWQPPSVITSRFVFWCTFYKVSGAQKAYMALQNTHRPHRGYSR